MKAANATHHQGDIRYGMPRGIQCSCMSLMVVYWALFYSASIWDFFGLDCILNIGELLLRYQNNYRYLGMAYLPQDIFIKNSSINVEFLNNRTGEITAESYLVSITEIKRDCQQLGKWTLNRLLITTF